MLAEKATVFRSPDSRMGELRDHIEFSESEGDDGDKPAGRCQVVSVVE
jgi:hypothetical protein